MKILCLGNEFIEEDSFAIKVSKILNNLGFKTISIIDSFQLMEHLTDENITIIDVVKNLNKTTLIKSSDIKSDSILTAHDFDAGYIINLLGNKEKIKIIGIPSTGNLEEISNEIKQILDSLYSD
ncbi:MAG: hypothetical protein WC867_06690 [Candidatus Pacearchaeota archaeon]|jgi:Ni,Fe-hydrogenase maturation factor